MSQLFASGGPSIGAYWFDLLAVQGTLKSFLQHHSSKASIPQHSAFFMVQLSHPHMTTGKTIALTIWTLVGNAEGNGSHSSTLAWKIPWTEEPGRLQSMGSQRVRHNRATFLSLVGKAMSLLFNTLSRFVTAFLPKSNHLLISWLQSPSAVILEPPKNKVCHCIVSPSISHEVMGPDAMILVF